MKTILLMTLMLFVIALQAQTLVAPEGTLCLSQSKATNQILYGNREAILQYVTKMRKEPSDQRLLILDNLGTGHHGPDSQSIFAQQSDGSWKRVGIYIPTVQGNQFVILKTVYYDQNNHLNLVTKIL